MIAILVLVLQLCVIAFSLAILGLVVQTYVVEPAVLRLRKRASARRNGGTVTYRDGRLV